MNVRRNAIANFLGQGWVALMGFAFIPIYIRLLGLEAYGLIGIFALLQTWLSLLDFGLTPAIGREMARYLGGGHDAQSIRDLLRSVELAAVAIAFVIAAVMWLSSGWLSSHWLHFEQLRAPEVAIAFAIMGIVAGSRFVEGIYRSSAIGLQQQVSLNVIVTVSSTVRALGAVLALTLISATVTTFFVWQAVVSAISVGLLAVLVHGSLPSAPRPSGFAFRPLTRVWRFAAGTLAITVLGFVLSQIDKLILSALLSLSAFALYSLAQTVASSVRLLAQPIDQAVFPRLAQLYEQKDERELIALYHKAAQYNSVLMGGAGVFLAVFGDLLLTLWTADPDLAAKAYPVLWILVIGRVLNGTMNTPYYLQLAAGWTALLIRINAVLVAVFVPVIFIMTQRFQMTGAATAWVALNLVYVLVVARFVHRRLLIGELRAWYLNDVVAPLLAGVVTALVLRQLVPRNGSTVEHAFVLGLSLAGVLLASALAAAQVRSALGRQARQVLRMAV
jgi:O-antigen/teichoic acid export membrane protein